MSEAFESNKKDGCIELTVKMLNINFGHNKELLESCKSLYGYSYFVSRVRYHKKYMPTETAAITVIDECIHKGILVDFLKAQKSEVIAMCIYEYDEEKAKKVYYEDGFEDGIIQGISDSIIELLEELGNVPESLRKTIKNEKDISVLKKWCKLSARSENIEKFMETMNSL